MVSTFLVSLFLHLPCMTRIETKQLITTVYGEARGYNTGFRTKSKWRTVLQQPHYFLPGGADPPWTPKAA